MAGTVGGALFAVATPLAGIGGSPLSLVGSAAAGVAIEAAGAAAVAAAALRVSVASAVAAVPSAAVAVAAPIAGSLVGALSWSVPALTVAGALGGAFLAGYGLGTGLLAIWDWVGQQYRAPAGSWEGALASEVPWPPAGVRYKFWWSIRAWAEGPGGVKKVWSWAEVGGYFGFSQGLADSDRGYPTLVQVGTLNQADPWTQANYAGSDFKRYSIRPWGNNDSIGEVLGPAEIYLISGIIVEGGSAPARLSAPVAVNNPASVTTGDWFARQQSPSGGFSPVLAPSLSEPVAVAVDPVGRLAVIPDTRGSDQPVGASAGAPATAIPAAGVGDLAASRVAAGAVSRAVPPPMVAAAPFVPSPVPGRRVAEPMAPPIPVNPPDVAEPAAPGERAVRGRTVGAVADRPAPTPEGLAEAIGRIERMVGIGLEECCCDGEAGGVDLSEVLDAIQGLRDDLLYEVGGDVYEIHPPCGATADGEPLPPVLFPVPAAIGEAGAAVARLDVIAEMIAMLKTLPQPVCKGARPIGNPVTVTFVEGE